MRAEWLNAKSVHAMIGELRQARADVAEVRTEIAAKDRELKLDTLRIGNKLDPNPERA